MKAYIDALIEYGLGKGLIQPEDRSFVFNRLLEITASDAAEDTAAPVAAPLNELLGTLTDDAVRRGLVDDTAAARELFDTKLMGALTPWPHEVQRRFKELYICSP